MTALPAGKRGGVPDVLVTARIWRLARGIRLTAASAKYLPELAGRSDLERADGGKAQQCDIARGFSTNLNAGSTDFFPGFVAWAGAAAFAAGGDCAATPPVTSKPTTNAAVQRHQ